MLLDIDPLLSLTECLKPRTPKELRDWVLAKCDAFSPRSLNSVKRFFAIRVPSNGSMKEVYPLKRFCGSSIRRPRRRFMCAHPR